MTEQSPQPSPLDDRPAQRAGGFADWAGLMLSDHGFIRAVYSNFHQVSPQMYRSAQPAPVHIARAARLGIRTVVNLRGPRDCGSYRLEAEACRVHGLGFVDFPVSSRDAPRKDRLLALPGLFAGLRYPALMHCKSGADRVGLMSVLYLFVHENRPLEEALGQLSLRFGHIRQGKTGILDFFFATYAAHHAARPTPFMEWVETVYDPAELKRRFKPRGWGNLLVDRILRRE